MPCHGKKGHKMPMSSAEALKMNKKIDRHMTASDMKKDIASDKKQLAKKLKNA